MTKKPLKIVSVSSEVAPFSKTGGLGDVAGYLPQFLQGIGNEVIIITPYYEQIIDKEQHGLELVHQDIKIHINGDNPLAFNVWRGFLKNIPVYFIENKKYFSCRKSLYGSSHENARFMAFDIAALKLLDVLGFKADIIQCHDWQTGLMPYYLKNDFKDSETLKNSKTIFTIHNLAFQFGHNWWEIPGNERDNGKKPLPSINDPEIEKINFSKRAILHSDAINTVSEQYREEIMTKNFGQDLHRVLSHRQSRLFGIVNGIDNDAYNPMNDPGLIKNYSSGDIHNKKANKAQLQQIFGLPVEPDVPLIGLTSRVTFQKGFDLILPILEYILRLDIQVIVMGDGDKRYIDVLKKNCKKHPKKIAWVPFDPSKETLIYAGTDMFLLPSHHEPCGINQMIAMRYGSVPIVRHVGGLSDTVKAYNPRTKRGTGFSFVHFDTYALHGAIIRALETYKYPEIWKGISIQAMEESNGWEIPAKKYEALFKKIIKNNI